jgi:hypothetical protein
MGLLPEQVLHHLLYARNAGRSANQHYFVDLSRLEASVLQRLSTRLEAPLE